MESLILFLLKNWYLVIIAGAFYYQIKARRTRSQQRTSKPGMPSFGGGPTDARRPPEPKRSQMHLPGKSERIERVKDEFKQSVIAKSQAVGVKEPKVSPFPPQSSKAGKSDSPIYANDIALSSVFPNQPSREQLLQGVVWAEILGPPRSKKPHRK